jgi:carboxypeptidase C (cathepsin A)
MNLLADFMVSFQDELTLLLSNLPVLLYSGQLDVIIGAATTERYLADIVWPGSTAFASAERSVWRLTASDPEVAGYVRAGGNLTYAAQKRQSSAPVLAVSPFHLFGLPSSSGQCASPL